ncbi:hypothetical protein TOPH_04719 [Tolypocladium ophioglossoides CBS 100239]|uniref:Uncharacterized protein n=1 Tax=Tolypocladium ophioglossoides (strain CBS 100239) TaxID=1163406 RepID=A0A0L0N930_TOLOC|nr:hypothetical protein TOPH_04719 [Tolypocladium ophioglossoides CBS 100239]
MSLFIWWRDLGRLEQEHAALGDPGHPALAAGGHLERDGCQQVGVPNGGGLRSGSGTGPGKRARARFSSSRLRILKSYPVRKSLPPFGRAELQENKSGIGHNNSLHADEPTFIHRIRQFVA